MSHPAPLLKTEGKPVLTRRESCRLCEGKDLQGVLHLAPTPRADDYISAENLHQVQETYPLDLFLCRSCGHVQLRDVIDPEILYRNYSYVTSTSLGLVEHFRKYAEDLLKAVQPPQDALVVEIGSNDGSMLQFFKNRGLRVLGIDPAREIARKATESGVETLPMFFTTECASQVRKERGPAAIIVANNVYAHADDLSDVTTGVRTLLAPNGVFVFEVSYLVDIVQKFLFDTVYHEHLCYHSVKPLQIFFQRHGLELFDIQRIPTKGGSIRCSVQLSNGPWPIAPIVQELIQLEENTGMNRSETFRVFSDRISAVRQKLLALLQDLKREGKKIAGYGASHTVTTLAHHLELWPLLEFVVDDNPHKQGLFSPGYHVPVLSPQALYERKPDYVLILAWSYSQTIRSKHQEFLRRGGHFIIPLPRLEVV